MYKKKIGYIMYLPLVLGTVSELPEVVVGDEGSPEKHSVTFQRQSESNQVSTF